MSTWQADDETLRQDAVLKKATPSPGVPTTPQTLMERFGKAFAAHLERLASRDPELFMRKARTWKEKHQ